jgi:hypothetical protein
MRIARADKWQGGAHNSIAVFASISCHVAPQTRRDGENRTLIVHESPDLQSAPENAG